MIQERVEEIIGGLRPVLSMQGKDISVVSADEAKIKLKMMGFCGGCGCSDDYMEGINEMLQKEFPHVEVEIEMSDK
ncbi:MAG: NifU family protein [Patescibacteria group bacterium]